MTFFLGILELLQKLFSFLWWRRVKSVVISPGTREEKGEGVDRKISPVPSFLPFHDETKRHIN
jgi:hypothetical protein